ncbi:hypothetical protein Tco_1485520 [Tanacetum coccineum]
MAYRSSSSNANSKVHTCSTECEQSYANLKKLYDTQREQLGDASIEIQAYTLALKKVEAQLVAHQKNQLWYEEKIRFMKIDLDDKTDTGPWMQDMSKDGLIPAIDMDIEKCNTCVLTKITKNPFQNVKHETKVLELIDSDLYDLHATLSLGNKKYFVTFIDDASRAVVRLPNLKLKTLGERGIEWIFVRYAEHSKAFRFYVIEPNDSVAINSIIESRDSIFDDHRMLLSGKKQLMMRWIPSWATTLGGWLIYLQVLDQKKAEVNLMNLVKASSLYVDDMLIFGTDQVQVDLYKELLSSRFSMKDMEEADVILVSTPLYTYEKPIPNKGLVVSQLEYSRVIGFLMYAMNCTRPDIAFDVGKLSRYTSNPGTKHWQAMQRVMKYLKKTMDYRLLYTGYTSVLKGYTDASWISNTEDNSSTSGWYEFVALAAAGKETK